MTQIELGAKLNYLDKTISKWERGESTPDIAVLVQIATLFGVSLDYLVGNENAEMLSERDYALKKDCYETAYGKKLTYTFEDTDIAGWKEAL